MYRHIANQSVQFHEKSSVPIVPIHNNYAGCRIFVGFCGIGRVGMIIEITYMWGSIF
jgi:hypothetical protein